MELVFEETAYKRWYLRPERSCAVLLDHGVHVPNLALLAVRQHQQPGRVLLLFFILRNN